MIEVLFMLFLVAFSVWVFRSRSSASALPGATLVGAEVVEVIESREFHGHSFVRLLLRRETGRRHDPTELVEAEGLMPGLWAPHVRSGVKVLVDLTEPPPLERLIPTDHVWNAEDFAAELASRFDDAEVEITGHSVAVAGRRDGVEASVEVDDDGFLFFHVVTPLRPEDDDLTVDLEGSDEDSTQAGQLLALGIVGNAWAAGAEERGVPADFRRAAEENQEAIAAWLEHFEELSFFDGRCETCTQLLVPEPRIGIDLLDAFIELTRFEPASSSGESTEPRESPEDSEGWW